MLNHQLCFYQKVTNLTLMNDKSPFFRMFNWSSTAAVYYDSLTSSWVGLPDTTEFYAFIICETSSVSPIDIEVYGESSPPINHTTHLQLSTYIIMK